MFHKSDEIPKSGQFAAVWKTENGTFAQTFKYRDDGYLLAYDMYHDEWECEHGYSEKFLVDVKASFIV